MKYCVIFLAAFLFSGIASAQQNGFGLTAVDALEGLSDESRFNRLLSGGITTAAGGVVTIIGLASRPDPDDYFFESDYELARASSGAVVFSGAIITGIGIATMIIPSAPERAWDRVDRLDDAERRESRAYSEINQLANNARSSRLLSGAMGLGVGAYYLIADPEDDSLNDAYLYNGIIFGALGVSQLLIKSPAERTLDRLDSQRADATGVSMDFGLALLPQNGLGLGMQVRF